MRPQQRAWAGNAVLVCIGVYAFLAFTMLLRPSTRPDSSTDSLEYAAIPTIPTIPVREGEAGSYSDQHLLRVPQESPLPVVAAASPAAASPPTLHVVAHADHADQQFCALLYSAAQAGMKMTILGWGDTVRNKARKLTTTLEFLKAIADDDRVLFTDGFDTMFIGGDLNELDTKFKAFNASIVVAAETNCWPFNYPFGDAPTMRFDVRGKVFIGQSICSEFPDKGPFRYVNSGNFIGIAKALYKLYDSIMNNPNMSEEMRKQMDDQREFALRYLDGGFGMAMDTQTTIFMPLEKAFHHLQKVDNRYVNRATHSQPLLIHFNGDKSQMNPFADKLRDDTKPLRAKLTVSSFYSFRDKKDIELSSVCAGNPWVPS
eukprot:GILJ01003967.1.p1 GENE.GILJ01003967.1~~GILJ01003967.1.p1  ORF type:complete len:373 (-),score=50.66 GILJ01003967.1:322-1440(-)